MTDTQPRAEDLTRHLTLQYLVLAFSQLHIRHEALHYLDDLLTYLATAPEAPLPDGCTRGELASAYLDDLRRDGRCRDCDFRWLRDDPVFQDTLKRHRLQLEAAYLTRSHQAHFRCSDAATVGGPPGIVRTMDDLLWLDATAQAELVRNGEVAAIELVDAAIERIERLDPQLNAVILRRFERVREEARAGLPAGPFRGVPFLLKDVLCQIQGEPYHAGMRVLQEAGYRSGHDSYLGARYKRAGFAILGKTNLSELALSPITDSVAYGPARNPWDLERTAGGSSGGSAAAVAAGFVPVAHGSDSGGSIRIPASCCGVVGLLPSRGRTTLGPDFGERFGQKTCEHVLTRSVRDSAAVLDACAGPAPGDPYTAPPPARPWRDEVGADPGRLRIGFRTLRADERGWDSACAVAVETTVGLLADLGHAVEDDSPACLDTLVDRPMIEAMHLVKYAHVASELARLGALLGRELGASDVEPNTWSAAAAARGVSGVQLVQAMAEQHRYARRLAGWWAGGFDILVTPTLATLPFRFKEGRVEPGRLRALDLPRTSGGDKPLGPATFTWQYNVSGQPAISLPLHWSGEGVPVGVQLIAAYGREDLLFRLAAQLEAARPWADRRLPIAPIVRPA